MKDHNHKVHLLTDFQRKRLARLTHVHGFYAKQEYKTVNDVLYVLYEPHYAVWQREFSRQVLKLTTIMYRAN